MVTSGVEAVTTTIPCRAKDPGTCRYHGALNRAEVALAGGDIDGYLIASAELTAAIKTTPEVTDFFANQQAATSDTFVVDADRRRVRHGLRDADRTLANRISAHYRQDPNFYYTVGGVQADIHDEDWTTSRTIYQATAQRILQLATLEAQGGVTEYGLNRDALEHALNRAATDDALEDANDGDGDPATTRTILGTHDHVRDLLMQTYHNPIAPGGKVDRAGIYRLLKPLDTAYWVNPDGLSKIAK